MTQREALERIVRLVNVTDDAAGWSWNAEIAVKVYQIAQAALVAPPRECDVGTPYEQANRMRQFCAEQKRDGMRSCAYCPIAKPFTLDCALIWGQRTYKKGGEA